MSAREVVKRYVLGDCALWDACQQGLCACGCEHRADAILAALDAAGLAVVPVRPTWEMVESAENAANEYGRCHVRTWRTMIATHKEAMKGPEK